MKSTQRAVQTELQLKRPSSYSQLTLPHLLAEYGFEDQKALQQQKEKNKEKERCRLEKKPIKRLDQFINHEDEKALKRQNEKEEYYLKLIQDMYRLRDYYYKKYTRNLAEKVQKQQREIKDRDIQSEEKRKRKEEERHASNKMKKRLEYHNLETSTASRSVPKTDLYYIVGLEDRLVHEGKLKTVTDHNTFRLNIQDPHVFYINFKVQKSSDHVSRHGQDNSAGLILPLTAEKLSQISESRQELRPLSQITESKEYSIADSWAITQQYPAQYKKRASISGHQTSKPKQDSHSDLDKRFPKVEMPRLHCFNMNLASKPPDMKQVQQESELKAKEKHRKKLMRSVAKMYQLAMSNVATSARILDQHEDMDMLFNGPDLCDVIADNHWIQAYGLHDPVAADQTIDELTCQDMLVPVMEETELDEIEAVKEQNEPDIVSLPPLSSGEQHSDARASETRMEESSQGFVKSKISLSDEVKTLSLPLTMEEISDKCHILEAKSLSTFWTNYMAAGKG